MLIISEKNRKILFKVLIAFLLLIICTISLSKLTDIPRGLYHDESDIAYNAALIAASGHDEHNVRFPLYFKSFNDFKSPVYIYTMAAVFKIFGVSYFNLKFTSFLYYLIFLISIMIFANDVFDRSKKMILYALISGAFLPGYFILAHVGFEIVSQPVFFMLALIFLHISFYNNDIPPNQRSSYAFIGGLMIGISVYTYPTARMLSFILLFLFFIFHAEKKHWQNLARTASGFAAALVPYIIYSISSFDTLLQRFNGISYITDSHLTILEKLSMFADNYISYFEPGFLLVLGDPNMRHSTNVFGIISVAVFVLSIFCLCYIVYSRIIFKNRFVCFLAFFLLCSPAAAALTNDKFHSLRSVLLCTSLLLLSMYGFHYLFEILKRYRLQYFFAGAIFISLAGQSAYYLNDYFTYYPAKSAHAFEYYGIEKHLHDISAINPDEIDFYDIGLGKSNIDFYGIVHPLNIPIGNKLPDANLKNCILFGRGSESMIKTKYPDYIKFNSQGCMIFMAVHKDLAFNIDPMNHPTGFFFDAAGNEKYRITYLSRREIIDESDYTVVKSSDEPFERSYITFTEKSVEVKADAFRITPHSGSGRVFNVQIIKDPDRRPLSEFQRRIPDGTRLDTGNAYLFQDRDLLIDLKNVIHNKVLNISTDDSNTYLMIFYNNGKETGRRVIAPHRAIGGFTDRQIATGATAAEAGYDSILLSPLYGDNRYYLGHLIF